MKKRIIFSVLAAVSALSFASCNLQKTVTVSVRDHNPANRYRLKDYTDTDFESDYHTTTLYRSHPASKPGKD